MFRKILVSFIFSLLLFVGYAQTKTYIGFSAGAAYSTLKANTSMLPYDYKTGYKINIPLIFSMNRNLSFNTGLSYFSIGAKQEGLWGVKYSMDPNDPLFQSFFSTESTFIDHLNYLSVPLTLNVYQRFRKFSTYAKVGGYLSYLVSANEMVIEQGESHKMKMQLSDGSINRFDAGILIGLGLLKPLGKGKIFLEGEYIVGQTNLYKFNSMMFYNSGDVFNRSFFLNTGYIIKIGSATCY